MCAQVHPGNTPPAWRKVVYMIVLATGNRSPEFFVLMVDKLNSFSLINTYKRLALFSGGVDYQCTYE